MEKETSDISVQSVQSDVARPLSIRKMYLNKRANVIRQSLEGHRENISGFIHEVHSTAFNATKDELFFARALQWMQTNIHTEAKIGVLAKALGMSVRKIQRLFSFFLGESYTTVLLDMRISAAKGYLKEMKNTVGEVAFLVGIKDHAYFTFLFRKTTGMTPTEFRFSITPPQKIG